MIDNGCLTNDEILDLYEKKRNQISYVFHTATSRPKLNTIEDLMLPIIPKVQRKKVLPIQN